MKKTKHYINLSVKTLEIANEYTLPSVDGSYGFIMVSDGVGNITWANPETLEITTNGVTEGSNLYFTDERVDDRVSSLILDGTGITWTYADNGANPGTFTGNVTLSPFSTTDLSEGSNLYFTDERVDDRVSGLIQNGTGISWAYNDVVNTLTPMISLASFDTDDLVEGATNKYFTTEAIDDRVAVLIKDGTGLTWTYNDPANTFTGNVSLGTFSTDDLSEGSNLYFTDERVDDRVSALMTDTETITWSYNNFTNALEANAASQPIQVNKAGILVSTRNILNFIEGPNTTINILDNGGTLATDITISSTGGGAGIGTLYEILSDGVTVGDADTEHLNFSEKFSVIESPDKYITVDILMLLGELADVDTSTVADGYMLEYVGSPGRWVAVPPPPALGGVTRTWSWSASNRKSVTNSYLKGAGNTFTNVTPYIAPFDCEITAISASSEFSETWSAEVHVNGSSIGSLSIFSSDNGYASPLSISVNAGDKISLYCNGTTINGPSITVWFNEI